MAGETETGWAIIWKINAASLRAAASGAIAYGLWWASAHPGYGIAVFFAVIFAMVAVKHGVIALAGVVRIILRGRRWAKYRRQGVAPKADGKALEADLKRRGLIR